MVRQARSLRENRHVDKTLYMGSDERFYEPDYAHYRPSGELLSLVERLMEERGAPWSTHRADVWTHVMPPAAGLPAQGWKIHVSANEGNCRAILGKVAGLALESGIQFKFANDVNTLKLMTSKRWPRGGSGKFITLYPPTDEEFHLFIERAYAILKDDVGSYILSDRRYRDCRCLYYRYGGFVSLTRMNYMGQKQQLLVAPDGEQVVDRRNPYFETPSWVSDPFPPDESDQGEMTLNEGRYVVKSALGFSNTGGVYLATDTATGKDVVIKEARPHVELGANGKDATARLAQEERNLRILDGLGIAPQVLASFWDWENYYLVEEYVDAFDMREVMVLKSPLLRANPSREDSAAFYQAYKHMFTSALEAIARIHDEGLVIGDLSPMNILVEKSTMTVRIIDLEGAFQPGLEDALDIHTPGFRAEVKGRKKESNFQDDVYAIGAIMLYSMFPVAALAFVRGDLFTEVLPVLVADIGWSDTPVGEVIRRLVDNTISCREAIALLEGPATIGQPLPSLPARGPAPEEVSAELAAFIVRNYRLKEVYTLFPIDPFGRNTNPLGFGFGAAGIMHALSACGAEVPRDAMARYRNELDTLEAAQLAPGFLVGAAGMGWALLAGGDAVSGKRFMQYANASPLVRAHHSLYYGMAGIGLANLAAYRILDDQHYLKIALELAQALAATAIVCERGLYWEDEGGIRIGFGYGQSGVALFFLRLSQILNAPEWRELGKKALEYDLSFGHALEPGAMTFACSPDETQTYEPYIEQGSAGIAKVAIRYGMWDRLDPIFADIHRKYSGFPGLIYGLTGFADVLLDAYLYSQDRKYLDMSERPLRGIMDLYLFKDKDGYATPGENLFRISCDYATGVAGIMRTLHRWARRQPDEFCLDELDALGSGSRRT